MVFFDNSATVNVFRKQPENRHSCLWQQSPIIVTPFPEPAANAETFWEPVNTHFALTLVIYFLHSLWLEASSFLYLSDTRFAQGAKVDGLATEQRRNNSSSLFSVLKTPQLSSMWYHFSRWDWKPCIQGNCFPFPRFQNLVWAIPKLPTSGMNLFNAGALVGLGKASSQLWLNEEKGSRFVRRFAERYNSGGSSRWCEMIHLHKENVRAFSVAG